MLSPPLFLLVTLLIAHGIESRGTTKRCGARGRAAAAAAEGREPTAGAG